MAAPLKAKGVPGADVAAVDPVKWLVPPIIEEVTETLFHGVGAVTFVPAVRSMLVKAPVIAPVLKLAENDPSPSNEALAMPPDEGNVVTMPATL